MFGSWGMSQRQVCRDASGHVCMRQGAIRVFFYPLANVFKGFPWLGSFFIAWHSRCSKNPPGWGLSLLSSTASAQMFTLSEIFLYCSVHQALKEPPSLGAFSLGQLPALTCGESVAIVMAPPPVHDSVVSSHLHGYLDFLQGHFLLQSPPSCPRRASSQNQQQSLPWDWFPKY